ncbi:MAG: hypothetical protein MK106_01840 [Mariniblastus sp.]|nr:hypothetical protein [Mariniblastus sp.]
MNISVALSVLILLLGGLEPQNLLPQVTAFKSFSAGDGTAAVQNVRWIQDNEPDWDEVYEEFLKNDPDLQKKITSGEMTKDELVQWIKENLDDGEFKNRKNWVDRNLALFITLVQLAWIVPTVLSLVFYHFYVKRRERRRSEALQVIAEEMGLDFKPEGDAVFQEGLPAFPLFEIGRAKKLTNLWQADTDDLKLGMFDYCFTVGHGKHKKVRRLTVVVVGSESLQAPSCHLRPTVAFWDPIGAMLGKQDINFEEHSAFSKAFVLKSPTEPEARDFFDSELMDFFAQHSDTSFESRDGAFLYFRQWKRVDPTSVAIRDFLGEGYAMLGALQDREARS